MSIYVRRNPEKLQNIEEGASSYANAGGHTDPEDIEQKEYANTAGSDPEDIEQKEFNNASGNQKGGNMSPMNEAQLTLLSPKSLLKLKSASKSGKKRKVLGLVAVISEKFAPALNEFLDKYGASVPEPVEKRQLRKNAIRVLINEPQARKDFAAFIANLSIDLAQEGAFRQFSNLSTMDVDDPGIIDPDTGEIFYPNTEQEKTFFGKLWDNVKDPLADVLGGIFKPGQEGEALSEAEKERLRLEQEKLAQQKQMQQIITYGLIGIGIIVVVAVLFKGKGGEPAPAKG